MAIFFFNRYGILHLFAFIATGATAAYGVGLAKVIFCILSIDTLHRSCRQLALKRLRNNREKVGFSGHGMDDKNTLTILEKYETLKLESGLPQSEFDASFRFSDIFKTLRQQVLCSCVFCSDFSFFFRVINKKKTQNKTG